MKLLRAAIATGLALLGSLGAAAAAVPAPPPALQIVAAARIAAVADRAARAAVTDPDRALAPAGAIADQSVGAGIVALTVQAPQVNSSYVSVPVVISTDGRVARTVYAGYRITNYIRTAVAAHDLAADAIVAEGDLAVARVPFNGRPGLDPSVFIGRRLRAAIPRASVIYPEQTAVNLIVRAGMPAVLIVHDGAVSLAADVVARTSGGLGEFVTIFDPQTQRSLSGIVTAPDTVELTLPGAH